VASAGPYASLHLVPDRQPRQHLTTQFFTGRMLFLLSNRQSKALKLKRNCLLNILKFIVTVSAGKRQNSALCTLLNLNHEWIPGHSRTKIIFHDFSGPWKFRKKFQDFPGGARNLRYVVVVRNSISLLTFYHTNIYTHAYVHSWLQRLNHFACFPWEGKASPFPESYQQTHSNRSAISFLRQLSTWHCSHLLLSVVLWPRAAAPLLLGTWRSISHAHTVVSSKPAACHGCGRTTG